MIQKKMWLTNSEKYLDIDYEEELVLYSGKVLGNGFWKRITIG